MSIKICFSKLFKALRRESKQPRNKRTFERLDLKVLEEELARKKKAGA
jgi:hypothetical protein